MFAGLEKFEYRVYSQNGEDGVLARIFDVLVHTNRFFVEFGTGPDGTERNTRLLEEKGWTGLLMDRRPAGRAPRIRAEHVTAENVNQVFTNYSVPEEFDLLSIDVDGNDYWIWNALSPAYRPRVVVIEYNAAVPPTESKAITYDPDFEWQKTDYFGASLLALFRLGKRKGYKLIYCESTGVNAFFVRADLCPWEPDSVRDLYRPMAQFPHGGSFPHDTRRELIDVEKTSITGVVLARNEERNIVRCLEALRPHVDELILIDMESTDHTVALAQPIVNIVLHHPIVPNFDAVRNIAIPEAAFEWLWFVDSDEVVPEHVGRHITRLVQSHGDEFEAINYAFATHFGGHWMQHCGWWGYCTPRVLKKGHFRFSDILHRGVELNGREVRLPLDVAVPHYSFRDVGHWIDKFNRYTSIEAKQLADKGCQWDWRWAARGLAHDLWEHYELHDAKLDGNYGWIVTWAGSQYRWFTIAKLLDYFPDSPVSVPESLDEALQAISDELAVFRASRPKLPLGVVFRSPIWDYSGYADEGRTFAKALAQGSMELSVEAINWNSNECELPAEERGLLRALCRTRRAPYVVKITNCIPTLVEPDPGASLNVIRTTFETDRIPQDWLPKLEHFDEVWVTSTHTRDAFCRSWVPSEKIRVVSSCVDTSRFSPTGARLDLLPSQCNGRFVFLSVFDWQLRKGWDVLLRAYVSDFSPNENTFLLLKATCHHNQSMATIRDLADAVLEHFGTSLEERTDILIWEQALNADQMAALYRSVDCFVLASRGEGWGRPYIEAMASGLPVIGTCASGNAEFMHEENCFVVRSHCVEVPSVAVQEIPPYAGHHWLEPDLDDLRRQMRTVYANPSRREMVRKKGMSEITEMFGMEAGRRTLENAVAAATERFKPALVNQPTPQQIRMLLEGEFFAGHSFANVNEQLALALAEREEIALSIKRVVYSPQSGQLIYNAYRLERYLNDLLMEVHRLSFATAFHPTGSLLTPIASGFTFNRGNWITCQTTGWFHCAIGLMRIGCPQIMFATSICEVELLPTKFMSFRGA